MNTATTWVARFLDNRAVEDIEKTVALWREKNLPLRKLADALRVAVTQVDARAQTNGHPKAIDIHEVDWMVLAKYCVERFAQVA